MVSVGYLVHFFEEDSPFGDLTSDAILPDVLCKAVIRVEEGGIVAGIEEASLLCSYFGITSCQGKRDGETVLPGEIIISLTGRAKAILAVERTALNVIGRMSGIATQTRKMVNIASAGNPSCRIAATRKTCPGIRALDKKAVMLGGGDPHRMSLSDGILIKDNHLALISIKDAIKSAKKVSAYRKIEIEVETRSDAVTAATEGADILLLDNMKPDQIRQTLVDLKHKGLRDRVIIELSGGINENTLQNYVSLGVDVISMGALTHTVKNFSVTLELLPERR
jgi:nicotinate-nucleotide pyrophosphorylase (carboxylating)